MSTQTDTKSRFRVSMTSASLSAPSRSAAPPTQQWASKGPATGEATMGRSRRSASARAASKLSASSSSRQVSGTKGLEPTWVRQPVVALHPGPVEGRLHHAALAPVALALGQEDALPHQRLEAVQGHTLDQASVQQHLAHLVGVGEQEAAQVHHAEADRVAVLGRAALQEPQRRQPEVVQAAQDRVARGAGRGALAGGGVFSHGAS